MAGRAPIVQSPAPAVMSRRPRSVLALLFAAACGGEAAAPATTGFARLEREVFAVSCEGCHGGSSPSAGLSLAPGRAYDALVGVAPANAVARRDGLLRVAPGDPARSLLYHKVVADPGHHAGVDYGGPMPGGGRSALSQGQVDFIRQWIAEGAPRNGGAADAALLADRTPQSGRTFEPLAPPPAGSGLQLRIERFAVSANFERELFVYRKLGNAEPLYVKRIQTRMRPGSHHLLLYTFAAGTPSLLLPAENRVRDIRLPGGALNLLEMAPMAYHVFFAGSMTPESDYTFPEGVALRLPANAGLDLNAHYANRTAAELPGEAYANLHTVPAASVTKTARTLNCGNTRIELPPRTRTTVEHVCRMDEATTVFLLTSHMHELGERFAIYAVGGDRDGELLYENRDWEHPVILPLARPLALRAGEGLRAVITWNNTTDRVVRFGLTSRDEMGIVFGYAY